jgi:hypothetical protein
MSQKDKEYQLIEGWWCKAVHLKLLLRLCHDANRDGALCARTAAEDCCSRG